MVSPLVGRLCQTATLMFSRWRFTEARYNDLMVLHTLCFKAKRHA
jgi:hypothetical protein